MPIASISASHHPRVIALYLPQYHPTPHNDVWWGKGFTEWTNVVKAKPLYRGHYQPKIPADLGFYDLRLSEVREHQVQLAREAGIEGFCYYEYWFGNGREELERPFKEVVESGKPDFPFCLCWANENWCKKFWNRDGAVVDKQILAEQTYPANDADQHFMARLQAFRDPRYIRVDGKLLYVIYKPMDIPNLSDYIQRWQELAREHGLPGFYFCGFSFIADEEGERILKSGCQAIISYRNNRDLTHNAAWLWRKLWSIVLRRPRVYSYAKTWPNLISEKERTDNRYVPVLLSNWDHTPRSGTSGIVLQDSTPEEFQKHCIDVLGSVAKKSIPLCFLKSWNEWGEGNYIEPDIRFGKRYINALKTALTELC